MPMAIMIVIGLFADDDCDSDDVGSGSAEFADG
jgi:hypothetical protein